MMLRVDDILVATSGGVITHMAVIKQVFRRLARHNVKLNGPVYQLFFQAQVKYTGIHWDILSKEGISQVKKSKGGKFLKKLRCCVNWVDNVNWPP